MGFYASRPFGIGRVVGMLTPVQFDDELQAATGEIRDVSPDGKLPGELDAELAAAQAGPQADFRTRSVHVGVSAQQA